MEDAKKNVDDIAKFYNHSGRGKTLSTYYYHIEQMFEKKISKEPQMCVKSHEKAFITAYFCKYKKNKAFYDVIQALNNDNEITYAIALSSKSFFITSMNNNKDFSKYWLTVTEKSLLYTPIYPIPQGWNTPMKKALQNMVNSKFKKGLIPRTLHRYLDWDSLDWEIYHAVKKNLRSFDYTSTARKINSTPTTVRTRFLNKISPKCIQINYFFPKGHDSYLQAFLRIKTDFESSFVGALAKLPCTSYVYPLKDCLIAVLFHEDIDDLILNLKKLEKKEILESYLLYNPLICTEDNSI
ncbi:MAG: hypothetical protein PVF58_08585 [Candidatus Methanofastidiosia archaeon]